MKSKTNSEETFDATKELCDSNKNNGAGTNGDHKKRARIIFGTIYRGGNDAKPSEQSGSGTRAQARVKAKLFLGQ